MLRATLPAPPISIALCLTLKHRRRRLGRNARDFAIDEIVEHDVADAKNGLPGNEPERFFEIEHAVPRGLRPRLCSPIAIGAIEIAAHVALHRPPRAK